MFTTACFINKNTPFLRKKLEELGYTIIENGVNEWRVDIDKCTCLTTGVSQENSYMGIMGLWGGSSIDCEDNEQLFLAIAALRDDSDKYQWFINDEGTFVFCTDDEFYIGIAKYRNYGLTNWYKATVEELIKYFKSK